MIDTLTLNFQIPPIAQSELVFWDYYRIAKKFKKYRKVIYLPNGTHLQLEYFPKIQLLKIEFSLPHLLFGNNTQQVYNLSKSIDAANKEIVKIWSIPKIDLWDGVLCRLDVCYNHQVEDMVPYFIRAMKFMDYSRRDTLPYPNGVVFKNKQRSSKFYDKETERMKARDPQGALAAKGILRQEITIRKRALRSVTGIKQPTLRDITVDLLIDILENDLKALGIYGTSIGTKNTIPEKLCAAYGPLAGIYYSGIITFKIEMPNEEIICSITHKHPRTLDRQLSKIIDAGVPLTLTETSEPLPPLFIDRALVEKLSKT